MLGVGVFIGFVVEMWFKGNVLMGVFDDFEMSFESGERL